MAQTLAERLGFAADGRAWRSCTATTSECVTPRTRARFEALAHGPATCGSVMVPCPWFAEAARARASDPGLDLGVHLTLNAEWPHYRWGPVAGPRRACPRSLDAQGYLPRTTLEVVQRAKPEEVEIELRAQIETALAAGIDVTHLDAHMGTGFYPPFVPVYAKLAREYRAAGRSRVRPDAADARRRRPPGRRELLRGPRGRARRTPACRCSTASTRTRSTSRAGAGERTTRRRLAQLGPASTI